MISETVTVIAVNPGQQRQLIDQTTGQPTAASEMLVSIRFRFPDGGQFERMVSESDATTYTYGATFSLTIGSASKSS